MSKDNFGILQTVTSDPHTTPLCPSTTIQLDAYREVVEDTAKPPELLSETSSLLASHPEEPPKTVTVNFHFMRHAHAECNVTEHEYRKKTRKLRESLDEALSRLDQMTPSSEAYSFTARKIRRLGNEIDARKKYGHPFQHIDAPLTKEGVKECEKAQDDIDELEEEFGDLTHVLCSPLTRPLQTALKSIPQYIFDRGVRITAWAQIRELSTGCAANQNRPVEDLRREMAGQPIDFHDELVPEDWQKMASPDAMMDKSDTEQRREEVAQEIKRELRKFAYVIVKGGEWKGVKYEGCEEGTEAFNVLVVSHGHVLKALTKKDWQWGNAQIEQQSVVVHVAISQE